jgi:hypothetical protein
MTEMLYLKNIVKNPEVVQTTTNHLNHNLLHNGPLKSHNKDDHSTKVCWDIHLVALLASDHSIFSFFDIYTNSM